MNYKITGAFNKTKKYFIIYAILWLFIVIVFVMPMGAGIAEANVNGVFDMGKCITTFTSYALKPLSSFGKIFTPEYLPSFVSVLWKFTFIWIIFAHGSSDWSQRGEQYRILSNKKGIILAEGNYLPVDKRGNVNVLVVGRFRFW